VRGNDCLIHPSEQGFVLRYNVSPDTKAIFRAHDRDNDLDEIVDKLLTLKVPQRKPSQA